MAGAGQPKPAFYVVVGLVVVALIGFAIYRSDILAPKAPGDAPEADQPRRPGGRRRRRAGTFRRSAAESTENAANITTVKEYKFQPARALPAVKGVSAYKPLADNTRPLRHQRLGRLGADHPGQRRLQGRARSGRRPTARSSRSSWC